MAYTGSYLALKSSPLCILRLFLFIGSFRIPNGEVIQISFNGNDTLDIRLFITFVGIESKLCSFVASTSSSPSVDIESSGNTYTFGLLATYPTVLNVPLTRFWATHTSKTLTNIIETNIELLPNTKLQIFSDTAKFLSLILATYR